jgi:hypothetical protein
MPIPQIDDVRPILEDFELRIRKLLEAAWEEDWLTLPTRQRSILSKRSRASAVFDFARHRALIEFGDDAEIQVIPKGQTVQFLFRNRVLVRIKKANAKGLGSNIQTQAVIEFVNPQIPLFDLPEIYHVEVCYQEDLYASRIASIAVTARQLYRKIWSYELLRPGTASVVPMPARSQTADNVTPASARPRHIEKKDKKG